MTLIISEEEFYKSILQMQTEKILLYQTVEISLNDSKQLSQGYRRIIDICPGGDTFKFSSEKPLEGITKITVINLDTNTVRITATGETALPKVELFDSGQGLIFGLAPAASTARKPQPKPEPEETQPETPSKKPSSDDVIEFVVTGLQNQGYNPDNATVGTRTDTPIRDVPQSIQVVPRQVIEDQGITNVTEALRNVPGVVIRSSFRNGWRRASN